MSPRNKGIACVLFAVTVWSGWVVLGRYSVRGSLTAYDITALRFGVAGILLLPVLIKKGLSIGPYGWKGGLLLGMLMGAPYNTIAIAAMRYAPVSHAALINTTMLTITTVVGLIWLKERTNALRMLGVILSVGGIGCMLYASGDGGDKAWLGSLMFIIGGTMWAGYTLCVRAWKADPLHATAAVSTMSLLYLPIYFLFIPSHIGMDNIGEVLFEAGYQGVINSIIALLCFNRGIQLLGATMSSAFLPLVLIFSTLMAIPLLGEMPGNLEWAGIALASVGVLLSTGIFNRKA